jgi:phosphatidylglycerophosphate synthase
LIRGRFSTAANYISLSRIPIAGAACLLLSRGSLTAAGIMTALAIATDAADGAVARRTSTESDWGRILDPAADKIAFAMMAITLNRMGAFPLWMLGVILFRDLLISLGGILLAGKTRPPGANVFGKLSTVFLALFIVRQAFFPRLQLSVSDSFSGTDALGLFSVLLILVSFVSYGIGFLVKWRRNEA